ncbi:MAG TPA: LysR substrate-binding domain-containing protein [Mycobacteriales bacterium]|nr:LysR substrate-binding domain-containing protein [Mycobacteriales bacterium]
MDAASEGERSRPGALRLADAERELAETARVGLNQLRVAAFATAAATVLPPAAGLFREQMPTVELAVTEGDPGDTLAALHAGDHDVALAYDYPVLSGPGPDGLELEPLFVDQMCVALPAEHPLAGVDAVPLSALAYEPWCAPHHSVCRDALDLACRTAGFTPRIVSETNDYMVMQGLVAARVGVAVMPRLATAIAVRPGIAVRPLLGDVLERVTFIVTRTAGYRPAAVSTLRAALIHGVGLLDTHGLALEPFESEHTGLLNPA